MNEKDLSRVKRSFAKFHAVFEPLFGRKQWRERSQDYLASLLVQTADRRNAENLAEVGTGSARSFQRFLSDSKWQSDPVTAELQRWLRSRLSHVDAVWAIDDTGFPKQGRKSAGVARQYCGISGGVDNCQVGVFLAYIGPRGRALVDKRLYLPEEWTSDSDRCERAGIPETERAYKTKPQLALDLLTRAVELGSLRAGWVTGDDAYGRSPEFRDGIAALKLRYVLDVPSDFYVWPTDTAFYVPERKSDRGPAPTKERPVPNQLATLAGRAQRLTESAWRQIQIAEGAQGPRVYWFAAEPIRMSRDKKPGEIAWAVYRKNLDGSEPRYYISNAGPETDLETLGRVGGTRWPIETEFRTDKGCAGMDEYEVRSYKGWHHHITMCLLASAFLLMLEQDWKKKDAPGNPSASRTLGPRAAAKEALYWTRTDNTDNKHSEKQPEVQDLTHEATPATAKPNRV